MLSRFIMLERVILAADQAYARYSFGLAILASVLIPLKLSLTYIAIAPLLLMWLVRLPRVSTREKASFSHPSLSALTAFFLACFLSSFFGINCLRSLAELLAFTLFIGTAFCLIDIIRLHGPTVFLLGLILGQSVAALHTVLEKAFPDVVFRMFLGEVTESGQIVMTLVIGFGLLLYFGGVEHTSRSNRTAFLWKAWCFGNLFVFSALGFSHQSNLQASAVAVLCAMTLVSFLLAGVVCRKLEGTSRIELLLWVLAIPLLASALFLNMKRGPWAGVAFALFLLLILQRPKLLLPVVASALLIFFLTPPLQERLVQSKNHFFISGGRSEIWEIGFELATRFPLGIGYHNSQALRDFSERIPPELKHFHSNFINILVETGWLGLVCFLWWIFGLITLGLRRTQSDRQAVLAQSLAVSLLAWQVAGIVEYNVGDSEVLFVAFFLMSALMSLTLSERTKAQIFEFPIEPVIDITKSKRRS